MLLCSTLKSLHCDKQIGRQLLHVIDVERDTKFAINALIVSKFTDCVKNIATTRVKSIFYCVEFVTKVGKVVKHGERVTCTNV